MRKSVKTGAMQDPTVDTADVVLADLSPGLLDWYDHHRRRLAWRAPAGERPDPYRVWLSEVMLQQTTVTAVGPYFKAFLARWPDIEALARASLDDVLAAWAGLGYYARARNLHACARVVVADHGGCFPDDETLLRQLPGVGRYTAAAIAAIAFDRPAAAVDGNVERVLARLFAVQTPLPRAKPALQHLAARLVPARRPGDHAQALMDLGATVCTPRDPKCGACPWASPCRALAQGIVDVLPRRRPKTAKAVRAGIAFFMVRPDGRFFLRQRSREGLLGGMWEVPTTAWDETMPSPAAARRAAPLALDWRPAQGTLQHSFTHLDLTLAVWCGRVREGSEARALEGRWIRASEIARLGVPTLMKKVIAHALGAERPRPATRGSRKAAR